MGARRFVIVLFLAVLSGCAAAPDPGSGPQWVKAHAGMLPEAVVAQADADLAAIIPNDEERGVWIGRAIRLQGDDAYRGVLSEGDDGIGFRKIPRSAFDNAPMVTVTVEFDRRAGPPVYRFLLEPSKGALSAQELAGVNSIVLKTRLYGNLRAPFSATDAPMADGRLRTPWTYCLECFEGAKSAEAYQRVDRRIDSLAGREWATLISLTLSPDRMDTPTGDVALAAARADIDFLEQDRERDVAARPADEAYKTFIAEQYRPRTLHAAVQARNCPSYYQRVGSSVSILEGNLQRARTQYDCLRGAMERWDADGFAKAHFSLAQEEARLWGATRNANRVKIKPPQEQIAPYAEKLRRYAGDIQSVAAQLEYAREEQRAQEEADAFLARQLASVYANMGFSQAQKDAMTGMVVDPATGALTTPALARASEARLSAGRPAGDGDSGASITLKCGELSGYEVRVGAGGACIATPIERPAAPETAAPATPSPAPSGGRVPEPCESGRRCTMKM